MSSSIAKTFTAVLEPDGTRLRWVVARIPFDVAKAWPERKRLLLTLEGETEPPPILQAAFQRQPLARKGWEVMTPLQRRNHLLSIFYNQTADGRERRAAKAVEEALRVARKGTAE